MLPTPNMPAKTTTPKETNTPATAFRFGRIQAAVWERKTEAGSFYSVTFRRSYQEEGKWHDTDSFGRDDLLLVAKLADQAHTWICQKLSAVG